jgi:hypothetical protein
MCFPLPQQILRVSCAAAFVLVALCGKVLGCSGPDAGEATAANHSIVNWWGVVAIPIFLGIVALYFFRGRMGIPAILLAIVVGFLHPPMWHYGGGGGDCGQSFVVLAKYVTIALAGLFLLHVALWRLRRPRFAASHT